MSKKLNVDFYHVETSTQTPDLGVLLGRINRLTPEQAKNVALDDGHVIRLHHYSRHRDLYEANMVRIRMKQVPVRASIGGALDPFALADDEGVGEQTVLIYNQRLKVIAIQRNRYGVSCATVAYYVRFLMGIYDASNLQAQPILEPDMVEKMERMTQIRSLDVRVASVINPRIFGSQITGYTARAMNKLMDDFQAPTVGISLSVGRRRYESLSLEQVKDTARSLLGMRRQHERSVTRLEVRGRDEDGDIAILNMLRAQMTEHVDVDTKGRDIPIEERRRAVRTALENRTIELRQMYGEPRS